MIGGRSKSSSEELPTARALHAVFRDYIKHEDTLVQYRVTWLLVLTGMLLTIYLTMYGLILYIISSSEQSPFMSEALRYPATRLIFIPIFLTSFVGLGACLVSLISIRAASATAKSILAAWENFKQSEFWREPDSLLPELTFGFSRKIQPTYGYPQVVCVAIASIWVISLGANIFLIGFFAVARTGLTAAPNVGG